MATQEAGSLSEGFGSGICVPAMTDLDELTNMGPMVILGVPFMRAFHATFSRKGVNEGTITLRREHNPVPDSIQGDGFTLVPFHAGESLSWRLD